MPALTTLKAFIDFLIPSGEHRQAQSRGVPPGDTLRASLKPSGGVALGVRQTPGAVRYGEFGALHIPSPEENAVAAVAEARGFTAIEVPPQAREADDIDLATVYGARWRDMAVSGNWAVIRLMAVFLDADHEPLALDPAHLGGRSITVKPYRLNRNGLVSIGTPITLTDGTEARDECNGRPTIYVVADLSLDGATSARLYVAPEAGNFSN